MTAGTKNAAERSQQARDTVGILSAVFRRQQQQQNVGHINPVEATGFLSSQPVQAGVRIGDMHELPVPDASFDTVLLMHALTYTRRPAAVLGEVRRVLRPGGKLLAVTLQKHRHEKAVAPYNHLNLGFTPDELEKLCRGTGLEPVSCHVAAVEKRAPNFAILTLLAKQPTG